MNDSTLILDAMPRGEPHAAEELLPLVYAGLREGISRERAGSG